MDEKTEQSKNNTSLAMLQIIRNRSYYTGFIGGVIWSTVGSVMYYFNFTEISHRSFTLEPWTNAAWADSPLGSIISIFLIGILSIFIALIYYVVCKRVTSIWMGIIFGAGLWGIMFYVLQPVFSNVPSLQHLETSTIVSTVCLYVLYGVFIGYTISYDYAVHKHKIKK